MGGHPLAAAPPGQDCVLLQRFLRVGHDQALVEYHFLAQTVTDRASPCGRVEGEMFRGERFVAFTRGGAEVAVGMQRFDPIGNLSDGVTEGWSGELAFDLGLWTLDRGLWAQGSGLRTLN